MDDALRGEGGLSEEVEEGDLQREAIACFPNCLREAAAVGIIAEDRPPLIAAGRHVIRRPFELDADRTGHAPPMWRTRRGVSIPLKNPRIKLRAPRFLAPHGRSIGHP